MAGVLTRGWYENHTLEERWLEIMLVKNERFS